jgi:hypothetical protein
VESALDPCWGCGVRHDRNIPIRWEKQGGIFAKRPVCKLENALQSEDELSSRLAHRNDCCRGISRRINRIAVLDLTHLALSSLTRGTYQPRRFKARGAMTPTIHILSVCGILIFGVGGFMLIWAAQDTGKPSPIVIVTASALMAIGTALFVAGFFVPAGSNTVFKPCGVPAC